MNLDYDLIQRVRPEVDRIARRTPLDFSPVLSETSGREVYVKCENLQRTGSFKIRGATAKLQSLGPQERQRGVVAASAGNHGQGVAWVARELGIAATIYVPAVVPKTKLEGMKRLGARVVVSENEGFDATEAEAMEAAEREGGVWVSAYDDPWVMAGGGTVGSEIFEEMTDVDAVVIPVGGGGLAIGVGVAARSLSPRCRIVGVNTSASPAMHLSRRDGRPYLTLPPQPTIAEGLEGGLSARAFELANRFIDEVLVAEESSLGRAIAWTLKSHRFAIEGSAAVAVAALLDGLLSSAYRRLCLVLSGGNIDYRRLRDIVQQAPLE
jgi:threonine dehydratase